MDDKWVIDGLRLVVAIVVLSYASILDVRTRKVENGAWIILALVAITLIPVQLSVDGESLLYGLVLVPILAILADVYWEGKEGSAAAKYGPIIKYSAAVATVMAFGYAWGSKAYFQHLLAVPIMMLVLVAMYMTDIIRGGADAKALLSLAILFPIYPALGDFPILHGESEAAQLFFPFSFVVLINAAIITVFVPLYYVSRNIASGDTRFPQLFLGYKLEPSQVKGKHVWLMERMEGSEHVLYARPRHDEDLDKEVNLLAEAGHSRIWITPKIPFIVPLLASLFFSTVIGNLIFLASSI